MKIIKSIAQEFLKQKLSFFKISKNTARRKKKKNRKDQVTPQFIEKKYFHHLRFSNLSLKKRKFKMIVMIRKNKIKAKEI